MANHQLNDLFPFVFFLFNIIIIIIIIITVVIIYLAVIFQVLWRLYQEV